MIWILLCPPNGKAFWGVLGLERRGADRCDKLAIVYRRLSSSCALRASARMCLDCRWTPASLLVLDR